MADDGKQPEPNCCQKFGNGLSNFAEFLYNKETGQVMGRSGESWLKIGVFYLIFYGFLAAFFSAMLTVFLSTINDPKDGGPKLTQFIANKPGLTLVAPKGKAKDWGFYNNGTETDASKAYRKTVNALLETYAGDGEPCKDSADGRKESNCRFSTEKLGDCGNNITAVTKDTVCVYVKINKVFGWVPKASNGGGNYLNLKCSPDKDLVLEPAGFHIGSFPFKGEAANEFNLPVVALKIKTDTDTVYETINCKLDKDGTGIEISESSVAHRAFGQIDIEL